MALLVAIPDNYIYCSQNSALLNFTPTSDVGFVHAPALLSLLDIFFAISSTYSLFILGSKPIISRPVRKSVGEDILLQSMTERSFSLEKYNTNTKNWFSKWKTFVMSQRIITIGDEPSSSISRSGSFMSSRSVAILNFYTARFQKFKRSYSV